MEQRAGIPKCPKQKHTRWIEPIDHRSLDVLAFGLVEGSGIARMLRMKPIFEPLQHISAIENAYQNSSVKWRVGSVRNEVSSNRKCPSAPAPAMSARDVSNQVRRPTVPHHPTHTVILLKSPPNLEMYVLTQSREHFSAKSPNRWWSRWKEPEGAMVRSRETLQTRVILTIVKAEICSTSS